MSRILKIILLGLLIISCNNKTTTSFEVVPSMMQPNWEGIDVSQLPVQFGEILQFDIDSTNINAIILDFNSDEGEIWIGMCFIDNNRLFGRQIPNGLNNKNCLDLLDMTYINLEGLKHYKSIATLRIDIKKVGIGSLYPVIDLSELKQGFDFGIEQRNKKQVPCNESAYVLSPINECYFPINKIKL